MSPKNAFFSAACALLLAACEHAPSATSLGQAGDSPAAEPQASGPAAAANAASDSRLGTARLLALDDPAGAALVDAEIRGHQKKLAKLPRHVDTWVLLGRAWVRKARDTADPGYYLNARACADIVLDFAPGNLLARNLIGQTLLNDHKFYEARDVAEQILLKDPEDVTALGTLSDSLMEVGRYEEAVTAAEKMGAVKPGLPAYTRASYLSWLHGDTKTALVSARFAAESGRDPSFPEPRAWALVQAAMIFWHQGDYEGAEAGFKVALSELADYPAALAGMARVAMARGEPKRAVEMLEKAHKQNPLVDTAWRLGDARAAAGDSKGAGEAYEIAVRDGRRSDHRTLALFFAVKNRDLDEAVRLARGEMDQRAGIYTCDAYAWALYRAGKLALARENMDKATRLGTKDAMLLYHAGAIRMATGDKEQGEKLVREALSLNPKFDVVEAAEAAKLLGL